MRIPVPATAPDVALKRSKVFEAVATLRKKRPPCKLQTDLTVNYPVRLDRNLGADIGRAIRWTLPRRSSEKNEPRRGTHRASLTSDANSDSSGRSVRTESLVSSRCTHACTGDAPESRATSWIARRWFRPRGRVHQVHVPEKPTTDVRLCRDPCGCECLSPTDQPEASPAVRRWEAKESPPTGVTPSVARAETAGEVSRESVRFKGLEGPGLRRTFRCRYVRSCR